MARSSGPAGAANGKISKMVFYQLNGQEVIRGLGIKKKIKSKNVLAQNNSIKLLMAFFNKIKPFIKAGFKNKAAGTIHNYHNLATAYNRMHAVTFEGQQPVILYDKVLLSQGTALLPKQPNVARDPEGLRFNWDIEPELPWSTNQDQVMLLAWFPEISEALFSTAGAHRSTGTDLLPLPPSYRAIAAETYIAFVSEDRESVSNSVYLGSITQN